MENENKNVQAPSQSSEQKRHNHKKKYHKPKSYFLTPADGTQQQKSDATKQTSSAPQQKQKNNGGGQKSAKDNQQSTPRPERSAVSPASEQKNASVTPQKQQVSGNNGTSRNKRKHKRGNDKRGDVEKDSSSTQNGTPIAEVREQSKSATSPVGSKSDKLEKPTPRRGERPTDLAENEKYSDYEEFSYDELYGEDKISFNLPAKEDTKESTENIDDEKKPENVESGALVDVVGIKFKESGKTYYFDPNGITLKLGSHAIVKTARGLEYGEVALANTQVKESETVPPLRPVVRIATESDVKHHEENKEKENEAFRICNEKIIAHKLDMKLIDAQYTFDNSKLLFYFTSSGRVDFRDLVKDLASVFRTRIELRQVGIRDEAKMVGGFGPCGRALCCSLFLTDFGQVSIKMAKEQSLSLNATKISGICGRLMCCLRYEYETYEYEIKRTPPVDTVVRTADGIGVVTEISPLAGTIKVRLNASPELPPKSYKRETVSILKKKQG